MTTHTHQDGPSPAKQHRRPPVDLSTRRASLADARLLNRIFTHTFGDDPMCYWLYQWPAPTSPLRAAALQETRRVRLPAAKRLLVSKNEHTFIASNAVDGETVAISIWTVPNSDNARHHARKLTLYERLAGLAYKVYDTVVNIIIPPRLYALFYPEDAARLHRQSRWQAEMERSVKPYIKASHKAEGYWYLDFLYEPAGVVPEYSGRGIGTQMLQWGLDKADEEDRAVYLTASPAGANVYKRAGFKVIFTDVIFEGETGGPVPLCTMFRPSKSEREDEKY